MNPRQVHSRGRHRKGAGRRQGMIFSDTHRETCFPHTCAGVALFPIVHIGTEHVPRGVVLLVRPLSSLPTTPVCALRFRTLSPLPRPPHLFSLTALPPCPLSHPLTPLHPSTCPLSHPLTPLHTLHTLPNSTAHPPPPHPSSAPLDRPPRPRNGGAPPGRAR